MPRAIRKPRSAPTFAASWKWRVISRAKAGSSQTLKQLVDEKAEVIRAWVKDGKMAECDPYHLIFAIWSTTQHYADFDVQVRAVLGQEKAGEERFEDAARFLEQLFTRGLAIPK
jgi:TetR/AcrR family transcriptional regulator